MLRILYDDVQAPGVADLLALCAAPSLESAATLLLSAPKGKGAIGRGVQAGIEEAMQGLMDNAAAKLLEQMPAHVVPLITEVDGTIFPEFGLWLTDRQGNFAAVFAEEEALIGTGLEFAQMFSLLVQRRARQLADDPGAPAAARYGAAVVARPRLAVVR